MVKKIIIPALLFFSAVLIAVLAVALSFDRLKTAGISNPEVYDNPLARYELQSRMNKELEIIIDETNTETTAGLVFASNAQKTYPPNFKSDIIHYFYEQSNTSNPLSIYSSDREVVGLAFDDRALGSYLSEKAAGVNRDPQNARLKIEDGVAVEFIPGQTGKQTNLRGSAKSVKLALLEKKSGKPSLAVRQTDPELMLSETNNLGINQLIGRGMSDFSGSSEARIHNIEVGAARYNGLIIKPGEQFSFNSHLGPVTAAAGFLPELVIKAEGTVPEFGGGLCQVSSTAFRAAFFSGAQIDERKNHSYAVKYYKWISDDLPIAEGMDATIYPGVVDLKFTNDTSGSILISTYFEGQRLIFDFYGTADNRRVVFSGPETYDRQASGALKAKVVRTVIKDGLENEDIFYSNYVSPDRYPRTYEYVEEKTPPPPPSGQLQDNSSVIN